MTEKITKVNNLEETKRFAIYFANLLCGGETILLNGDLGAGKTTFTKFLAEALGVTEVVTSPTFNIVKVYNAKNFKLYHFDLYRLENYDELQEIGAEDILFKNEKDVILVEWPYKIDINYVNPIVIDIEKTGDNERIFKVKKWNF